MRRQGLGEALNHLNLAEGALGRGEWEAANSQIRACLESLFENVARIRLGSSKTRGQARKELESSSVLREPIARLIQSFFGVASGEGSHAGTSNEDEARGRFLTGLGICLLGLALMPELVRVEDALAEDLEQIREMSGGHEGWMRYGLDAEIRTSCPSCGDKQTLSECEVKREGNDTVYWCRSGCQKIVVVGPQVESLLREGETPWGERVIRNIAEMHIPIYDRGTGRRTHTFHARALRNALVKRDWGRIEIIKGSEEEKIILGSIDPVDQDSTN